MIDQILTEHSSSWRLVKALLTHVSNRQVTVGFGIGVARAAGFLTGAVVARALGPDRFAAYAVAFVVFSSLVPLTSFADTWMISRWGERDHQAIGRTVWAIKLSTMGVLLTLSLLLGLAWPELPARLGIDGGLLSMAVLASGTAALTTSAASWYQAHQNFKGYAILIAAPPFMALAVAALLRALGASDPLLYTAALAVSYAPTTGLAYHFLARVQPSAPGDAHLTREALAFGGWVTVGSLAFVVFQRVDMFLLASAAPSGEVGIYGAASRLSMVGGLFGSTLTAVMMPKGSRQVTWTKQATRRAYIRESVVTVLLMTSALVVMIATAGPLTLLVFGKAYASAVPYSRILLLAQILLIAQMPFYFAMYALGGGRWIAGLGVLQAVIAIGAGYSLIERYGASGAAWSNVVTYAVGAIGVVAFHLTAARWRPA